MLGGIIVEAVHFPSLENALLEARLPELPRDEIGWTKVSRAKLKAYKRFVDVFFDNKYKVRPLEFHCLVVDTHKLNDRTFNEGSREVGFNKEIFQICNKFANLYQRKFFHAYLDFRTTNSSTEELRLILNRSRKSKGDEREWPFRRVHFRDSSRVQALQLVDIMLGAIAYHKNGHYSAKDASPAKRELSDHILERAEIEDIRFDTPRAGKFTVWHRKLR